jgi:DNA-binding CsgD family transcriptional regulator
MGANSYSAIFQNLAPLYEAQTLESLPNHLLQFLRRVISSDAVAYNEVNLRRPRVKVAVDAVELGAPEFINALAAHINEHPLVRHQVDTGDPSARKISDFISKAKFHNSALYQEVYRHIGAEDQFALSVHAADDTIVALAMNRSRRSFTEKERATLNLLQPHFAQVYRNAQVLSQLQTQLYAVRAQMDKLPVGLVVLDSKLRIKFATAQAHRQLRQYFNHRHTTRSLPEILRVWISKASQWQGQALPAAVNSFSLDSARGKLTVRLVREQGSIESMLLLEETCQPLSVKTLSPLGLTARETEVLLWVARGKSNPEIGIILDAAPRTIQKHLEHIFFKLGVESRTAAARRAWEVLYPAVTGI